MKGTKGVKGDGEGDREKEEGEEGEGDGVGYKKRRGKGRGRNEKREKEGRNVQQPTPQAENGPANALIRRAGHTRGPSASRAAKAGNPPNPPSRGPVESGQAMRGRLGSRIKGGESNRREISKSFLPRRCFETRAVAVRLSPLPLALSPSSLSLSPLSPLPSLPHISSNNYQKLPIQAKL